MLSVLAPATWCGVVHFGNVQQLVAVTFNANMTFAMQVSNANTSLCADCVENGVGGFQIDRGNNDELTGTLYQWTSNGNCDKRCMLPLQNDGSISLKHWFWTEFYAQCWIFGVDFCTVSSHMPQCCQTNATFVKQLV